MTPRVLTIPPGLSFLDTLSDALLDGTIVPGFVPGLHPLSLAGATIFVPTRRAALALATVLATRLEAPAVLLPRILPLGGLEAIETDLLFAEAREDAFDAGLVPAIAPMPRRMILTRLILQWAKAVRRAIVAVEPGGARTLHAHEELLVAASAADAWTLAGDLATLSDDLVAEGVDWSRVAPLGTEAFDRYWGITLDFLKIVIERWPAILAERGEVDAGERQIALVDREIARLGRGGAEGPVIVAGSTGSNPATARLIAAIARLPQGAVVLPCLDQRLDAAGWAAVGGSDEGAAATHPQAALKRLLGTIGIDREAVASLGRERPPLAARARFVGEALRPAETTEAWRGYGRDEAAHAEALAGVTVIEAADEREEALAIAVALREALEGPGTAILVTPDRTLGRRVREDLSRWGIDIDVSSGEPLGTTPAGALTRLVLDSAVQELAPVEVLALLAHPLVRLGRPRGAVEALARTLEIAILRGVLPPRALHDPVGLVQRAREARAGAHAPDPLRRLSDAELNRLAAFTEDVVAALAPLTDLRPDTPLPAWLAAHAAVIETVTATPDQDTALSGIDGNALLGLFDALADAPEPGILLDAPGYAALFDRFAAETPVRGPNRSHPRLKILGLLEARLLSADLVVCGGLDEGVWPPQSRTDAFLNRPMRASLGLPPPERRIGQTAHDLTALMGAPRVILSRARKRGGAPTVPSRFVLRMAALAGESWAGPLARGDVYRAWAAALDAPATTRPVRRPAPRPPVALRPRKLSVTRIETLRRDPYAIYAERVLRLTPAEPIGAPMGPAQYGTRFHDVMAAFSNRYPAGPLPAGAAAVLQDAARDAFADAAEAPVFRAFIWPRVTGWATAFLDWDGARRTGAAAPLIEARGELQVPLDDGSVFTLTAQADRIEIGPTGLVTVIDYKTGAAPTLREVRAGFAPQLTLEAAMARRGAFAELGRDAAVEAASYVKLEAAGTAAVTELNWKDRTLGEVVAEHYEGLVTLLNSFRDPATGYLARPYPQFQARFGPYDHLARVKEWSVGAGEEDL